MDVLAGGSCSSGSLCGSCSSCTMSMEKEKEKELPPADLDGEVCVYTRRWLILGLNAFLMMIICLPWMQYVVVADVLIKYYGVTNQLVEWTTMLFNAIAIIVTFPAAWFLNKYGLRPTFLVAALGAAVGQWVKVLGCWPDRYWLMLLGQACSSISVNFMMSTPPRLAAVWFPADELSIAVGAGFVGQMGGVSLGCALAPLSVRPDWDVEQNFSGMLNIHLYLAGTATALLLAIFFLFQNQPPHPPSPAQAAAAALASSSDFLKSMKRICRDVHFILLVVSYTLITSVYVAMTTLLNRSVVEFFPDRSAETGWLGMLITLSGLFGLIITSFILDKTKAFKEVTLLVYLGALVTLIGYTIALPTSTMTVVYWIAAFTGVFMTSIFVPGFEMSAEITYPEPEGNPASILNWIFQPFAMLTTLASGAIFDAYGVTAGHGFMCGLILVGFIIVLVIPKRYRRREAELALASSAKNTCGVGSAVEHQLLPSNGGCV